MSHATLNNINKHEIDSYYQAGPMLIIIHVNNNIKLISL